MSYSSMYIYVSAKSTKFLAICRLQKSNVQTYNFLCLPEWSIFKFVTFVKFYSFTNGDFSNKLYSTVNNYTIYYLSSSRALEWITYGAGHFLLFILLIYSKTSSTDTSVWDCFNDSFVIGKAPSDFYSEHWCKIFS